MYTKCTKFKTLSEQHEVKDLNIWQILKSVVVRGLNKKTKQVSAWKFTLKKDIFDILYSLTYDILIQTIEVFNEYYNSTSTLFLRKIRSKYK